MKLRHHRMFFLILPLSMMAAVLQYAVPVEAGSNVNRSIVPDRFFTVLKVSGYTHLAMQAATDQKKTEANPDIPLPEGPGRDTTKRVCSTCHSTNVWASQHHTRDEWSAVIDSMISKGLTASDDELAEINTYLAKSFPPLPKKDAPSEPSPKP
jgi:hypothetical protein